LPAGADIDLDAQQLILAHGGVRSASLSASEEALARVGVPSSEAFAGSGWTAEHGSGMIVRRPAAADEAAGEDVADESELLEELLRGRRESHPRTVAVSGGEYRG